MHFARGWKIALWGLLGLFLVGLGVWQWGSIDAPDPGDADLLVVREPWPDADNAFVQLARLPAWPLDADEDRILTGWFETRPGFESPWDPALAEAMLARLAPIRKRIDVALGCSRAQSSLGPFSAWVSLRGLPRARLVLALEFLVHTRAGRGARAIACAMDQVALGSLMAAGYGTTVHHRVGTTWRIKGLALLREAVTTTPADSAVLEDLVRRLGRVELDGTCALAAARADYTSCVAGLDAAGVPGPAAIELGFIVSPGYRYHPNETKRLLQVQLRHAVAEIARPIHERRPLPDPGRADRDRFAEVRTKLVPNGQGIEVAGMLEPMFDYQNIAYDTAELGATRILLAVAAHRLRTGHLPATLEDVRAVLGGEIPRDPFDGAPFRYDAGRRLVWVVGEGRVDLGGTATDWRSGDYLARFWTANPGWQLTE